MQINRIYLMDAFEFLNKLNEESIDLAIVDPPYNQKIDDWDTFKTEKEFLNFTYKWIDLTIDKLKKNGSIYIFNNVYNSVFIMSYLISKGMKFRNWIVWYKKDGFSPSKTRFVNNQEVILFFTKGDNYTFNCDAVRIPYLSKTRMKTAAKTGILKNGRRWYPNKKGKLCTDVWEFASVRHGEKINGKISKTCHPTPKPEKLIERIISASSNQGDLVLDLFSGSGTTAFVSKYLSRNFVGCENNEVYYEHIINRLNT